MEISLIVAVAAFAFITSVTPGPNNIMLLASGAQYGYMKTLPHMLGIVIGMAMLLFSVLIGLGALFTLYPALYSVLNVAGGAYLIWLAYKIATAPTDEINVRSDDRHGPIRWWESALFQFINPKAWMMSLGSVSTFSVPGDLYIQSGALIMLAFALLGFPAISIWAGAGAKIRIWLNTPTRRRQFNWIMGGLTVATLMLILEI
ncbi:LysE family translocator [Marinomonas balearica]|uniref:Threonine/homoserine/homoserine lactone efflux protein n=1 Tax=Marinomonas balearica TaxID=491947 RepID=A0A4R6MF27_9GAMM|nr:LysE family translocator [Marinomonas balearica]TDO98689.1 threonine/homoserine/homoserine lactone efflux protein [Marinomonas balearica]